MTPEKPTPETEAAIDDSPYYQSRSVMVEANFARKLERERDAARAEIEKMREAIKTANDSLHKCSRVIGAPKTYEWADEDVCDAAYNSAQASLAKLKPFIYHDT